MGADESSLSEHRRRRKERVGSRVPPRRERRERARVAAGARVLAPAARRERVTEERRGRVPEADELLRPVRDDDRVAAPPRRVAERRRRRRRERRGRARERRAQRDERSRPPAAPGRDHGAGPARGQAELQRDDPGARRLASKRVVRDRAQARPARGEARHVEVAVEAAKAGPGQPHERRLAHARERQHRRPIREGRDLQKRQELVLRRRRERLLVEGGGEEIAGHHPFSWLSFGLLSHTRPLVLTFKSLQRSKGFCREAGALPFFK